MTAEFRYGNVPFLTWLRGFSKNARSDANLLPGHSLKFSQILLLLKTD